MSLENGRTYIDSAHNKREYESKTENAFNRVRFKAPKNTDYMFENASDTIVLSLEYREVMDSDSAVSSRGGHTHLSSYSMKETKEDEPVTLYVPGSAPRYTKHDFDKDGSLKLLPDKGLYYQDEHAERFPKQQYMAMFRALTVTNPTFRFNKVHIVVNRTVLLNLITFIKGASTQAFHLELDMEENTLFIGRKVRNAKSDLGTDPEKPSFGHALEAALTTKDPELGDATSHHRFLMYPLGPLNIVVRYEVDAYMAESEVPHDPNRAPCHYPEAVPDAISAAIGPQMPPATVVIAKGTPIKQHQLIEMKSGKSSRPLEQMWFGRTPNCVTGKPLKEVTPEGVRYGVYTHKITKTQYVTQTGEKDFEDWEQQNQPWLRKLVWLLQKLRDTVEKTKDRSAIFVSLAEKDNKRFTVYETKERIGALPKDLVERFWDKE